jgi:isopenicillin N synthase-like dioxygenase
MSTTTELQQQEFTKLELRTAYGPVYRNVSTRPARDARADEIPLIDLSPIYGDADARRALAQKIKHAAENTGFFYVQNHGIPDSAIEGALNASKAFFAQPEDKKLLVSKHKGKWYNGYAGNGSGMASPSEGREYPPP